MTIIFQKLEEVTWSEKPKTLKVGSFYWVRTVIGAEREAMMPETDWQPARYTGRTLEGNHHDTWDFIGFMSADGHHHVDVMEVGEEILR